MSRLLNASGLRLLTSAGDFQLAVPGHTNGCCGCFDASGCTCTTITNANGSTWTLHPTISGLLTWSFGGVGPFTFDTSTNAWATTPAGGARISVTPGTWSFYEGPPTIANCIFSSSAYVGYYTLNGSGGVTYTAGTDPSLKPPSATPLWFDLFWSFSTDFVLLIDAAATAGLVVNGIAANDGPDAVLTTGGLATCSARASAMTLIGISFNPNLTHP